MLAKRTQSVRESHRTILIHTMYKYLHFAFICLKVMEIERSKFDLKHDCFQHFMPVLLNAM